jgi:hypothetical protein
LRRYTKGDRERKAEAATIIEVGQRQNRSPRHPPRSKPSFIESNVII